MWGWPTHSAGAVMAKIHSEAVWCQGAQPRGVWGLPAWKTAPWLHLVHGGVGIGAVPVGAGAVVGRQSIPGVQTANASLQAGGERQAGISWPVLSPEYSYLGKMAPSF